MNPPVALFSAMLYNRVQELDQAAEPTRIAQGVCSLLASTLQPRAEFQGSRRAEPLVSPARNS